MKMRTFINLFKVKANGQQEHTDRFEVNLDKPWSVTANKAGAPTLTFFPLGEDEPRSFVMGQGTAWSLGYAAATS